MTEISVVIPVFNGEAFLEECLSSVMSQSFRDFEVIVVNDGSSDSSLAIAKRFADRDDRFKIITIPHSGLSAARNKGVSCGRGKYVTFLDADDCLYPYTLETYARVASDFDANVVIGSFTRSKSYRIPSPESAGGTRLKALDVTVRIYDFVGAMKTALYQKVILSSACGALVKREFINMEKGFREGIWYEDLDAFYRFYQHVSRIAYVDAPLYFYRDNSESFTNRWSEGRLDVLDVTDRIVDFFKEKYPDVVPAALDRRFSAHYNMLLLMYRNGVDNPEAEERCWKVIREGRRRALTDRNVRLKNKLGALLSFGGRRLIKLLS